MNEKRTEDLLALSALCSALSVVFLDPESGVSVRLNAIEARLPGPVLERVRGLLAAPAEQEDLGAEYVRLFLHGAQSPTVHPYESVYLHGRLMAPEVLTDLKRIQGEAGIRPRAGMPIPPDHLALELELLAYLLEQADSDPEEPRWRTLALCLLEEHLLPFAQAFSGRLEAAKPHAYYHRAGELLITGLNACATRLGLDPELSPGPRRPA